MWRKGKWREKRWEGEMRKRDDGEKRGKRDRW